jgi:hypothetical protein
MRHWLWRVMGVLSLGGGSTGLIYASAAVLTGGQPLVFWITVALGTLLYGAGVWSGLRLLEGRPGAERMNLLYWCLQIPFVNTPVLAFSFYSGATAVISASIGWDESGSDQMNFSANAVFGSSLDWSYMQGDVPWEFGVNALACLFVWWGGRLLRRQTDVAKLEVW